MRALKTSEFMLMPFIVTLCGSTKFKKEFEKAAIDESLKGHIVLTVSFFPHADKIEITDEEKEQLDLLHLRKIDISDEILVLNVDGYIGESTFNEINHAVKRGVHVRYLEPKLNIYPKEE